MNDSSRKQLRIGLTGGIASGKSTVADLFANLGVPVIDTDAVAREVVNPGEPGLDSVVKQFGPEILQPDGFLDRAQLRKIIFATPEAREQLNNILHPLIRARATHLIEQIDAPYLVLEIPLLAETGFTDLVDRVLVVDCPQELQKLRLITRDCETEESANKIIEAQATRAQRLAIADDIICNEGSLENLTLLVNELHRRYMRHNLPDNAAS